MPWAMTFFFHDHRRYASEPSGISSSAFSMTVAAEVITGGKLLIPVIFHPLFATKKEEDFFWIASPAEYSTKSKR